MTKKSECIQKTHKMMDEIWEEESSDLGYVIIIEVDKDSFIPCKTKYPLTSLNQVLRFYEKSKITDIPVYYYYHGDNRKCDMIKEKRIVASEINRMVKWFVK